MDYSFSEKYNGITGSAIRQIFSLLSDPEIISFAGGNPSPATFPREQMADISKEVLLEMGDVLLQYGDTAGRKSMIETVTELFAEEGTKPEPGEVIILSGSSQGIDLMAKAMLNEGDRVLVESPTFLGALQTMRLYGGVPVGVEMDGEGIVIADLERKIKENTPKYLYIIPTFQNPSGRTTSGERRQAIVETCAKHGVMVLEDDPYGALRYAGEPQPSMKSFDQYGSVVKLMSFSKTISPGMRVGAAYGPAQVIRKFNMGKQGQDCHTSNLTQEMVARYIARGYYKEGIDAKCRYYAKKAKLMYELAKKFLPEGTNVIKAEGGMFIWAELPEQYNATEAFKTAVEKKVAYVPGTHFYAEGGHHNTLRLNFTMVDEDKIVKGMETLGTVFR